MSSPHSGFKIVSGLYKALLIYVFLFTTVAHSANDDLRLNFETNIVGDPPLGFVPGLTGNGRPVAWAVIEDTTAPAGPKVLAETSQDTTSSRFPLLILEGFKARNVDVRVRFSAISGTVDQAAGLMVRVQDERNYYVARANALEDNVRLYKVVNGIRRQFAATDIEVSADKWQELVIQAEGEHLTILLNGKELFNATDRTFANAGRVGLWTKADSLTYFDDLTVRRLP